jgi:hypothetical protein
MNILPVLLPHPSDRAEQDTNNGTEETLTTSTMRNRDRCEQMNHAQRSQWGKTDNPLVAEPLFLAGYPQRPGTGTLDMGYFSREAEPREHQFRFEHCQLIRFMDRDLSREERMTPSGQREEKGFGRKHQQSGVQSGLNSMTLAHKPSSRFHRYRLTASDEVLRKRLLVTPNLLPES